MTDLVNNLKKNDTVIINGTQFTCDTQALQGTHSVVVVIKGTRGAEKVLCWFPENNTGKIFSSKGTPRAKLVKTIQVK